MLSLIFNKTEIKQHVGHSFKKRKNINRSTCHHTLLVCESENITQSVFTLHPLPIALFTHLDQYMENGSWSQL